MAKVQTSLLTLTIVTATMAFTAASGARYTVGDPGGSWDMQTNLTAWQSSIDFETGDEIVFKYAAAAHDVVEVTRSGYRSCSVENPIATFRTGDDVIQLSGVLPRYFICGVPGHCTAGMKLEIRVGCDSLPQPPSAESTNGNGTPGGVCLGNNSPPTVITTPSFSSTASVRSSSVGWALVTMVLLMLGLMV